LKGDKNGAHEDYNKVLELDAKYINAYLMLGSILFDQNQKEIACQHWMKARELGSKEAKGLIDIYCK